VTDAVPLQSKTVDADPLCWLEFTQDAIITSCKSGTSEPYHPPIPPPFSGLTAA
jgi:catabolite repression protein CreC